MELNFIDRFIGITFTIGFGIIGLVWIIDLLLGSKNDNKKSQDEKKSQD